MTKAPQAKLKLAALALLTAIGSLGFAAESYAKGTKAPRVVVKQQIEAKFSQLEKELIRKHSADRAALVESLQRDDASSTLRAVQNHELKERHRLERQWLSQRRNEELCTLARVKCEKLAVRDMSGDDSSIPEYARDAGFVYEDQ